MRNPTTPTVTEELVAQLSAQASADPQGAFPVRSVVILALLAERADHLQQLAAAAITADNCELFRKKSVAWEEAAHDIQRQVDGNIRPTVRDCVNGMNDVQDIYDYCDRIDAAIAAARAIADT